MTARRLASAHLEWQPRDLWVGVYWERKPLWSTGHAVHVWVCLLPMLPLHVVVWFWSVKP